LTGLPELLDPVKGHEVRVMSARSTAFVVVKCRAGYDHQVIAVELPVRVLERMLRRVRMRENRLAHVPMAKVGRGDQGEGVPDRSGRGGARRGIRERPVQLRFPVVTNRKLLGSARKIYHFDEAKRLGLEARYSRRFDVVYTENVEQLAFRAEHDVSLQPMLSPRRVGRKRQGLRQSPRLRVEQVRLLGRGDR
jgi:hypothetical protein